MTERAVDAMDSRIGRRIQKYREKAGITQEELAEAVSLSKTAISNIERGANYPSFENYIKIANAIGVSSDLLLADVLEQAYEGKASELSERLKTVSLSKRQEIFAVVEILTQE